MQHGVKLQPCFFQFFQTFAVHIAAGRVRRAVGAVAADGKDSRVCHPGNALAGGERKLLVAAAEAAAGQTDNGLPARDKGKGSAAALMAFEDRGQKASRLARLAAKPVGQHDGFIAPLPRGGGRGGAQRADRAVQMGLDIVQLLCRLPAEKGKGVFRKRQAVFFDHGKRVGA